MKILNIRLLVAPMVAILASACLGFASWGFHKSSERGVDVTFDSTTKLKSGDVIPAGNYRMEVADNSQTPQVAFYRERTGADMGMERSYHPTATVVAKVVTEPTKNPNTVVDAVAEGNVQVVRSIKPAGWKEEILFGPAGK